MLVQRKKKTNEESQIKIVNNSELECDLQENEPKKLVVPPLIKIKLVLNNKIEVFGVYDSG